MLYVSAWAVSGYGGTVGRVTKPFNPLLGETFELVNPEKAWIVVGIVAKGSDRDIVFLEKRWCIIQQSSHSSVKGLDGKWLQTQISRASSGDRASSCVPSE